MKRAFTEEEDDHVNEAVDQSETVAAANAKQLPVGMVVGENETAMADKAQLPVEEAVGENETAMAAKALLLSRKSTHVSKKRKIYEEDDSSDSSEDSDNGDSEDDICVICKAKKPPNKSKVINWCIVMTIIGGHMYCEGIDSVNANESYSQVGSNSRMSQDRVKFAHPIFSSTGESHVT